MTQTFVPIDVETLKSLIAMAESYNEDLISGLDEGLYQEGDPKGNAKIIDEGLDIIENKKLSEIFIVVREGVYRHEILGAYTEFEGARARAEAASNNEHDDYHKFPILKFAANIDTKDGELMALIYRVYEKLPITKTLITKIDDHRIGGQNAQENEE